MGRALVITFLRDKMISSWLKMFVRGSAVSAVS